MATIDTFTLVAGSTGGFGFSLYGFRGTEYSASYTYGTLNGSTSHANTAYSWYSGGKLTRVERESTSSFTGIKVSVEYTSGVPSNSGWYDIRIGSSMTLLRSSATYSTSGTVATWAWSTSTNPFSTGSSYSIVVTDNGSTQSNRVTIPINISSGSISMNTLRNFFGEPTWGSSMISASDLYKGGNLVPTTGNSNVPTGGAIDLSDFYNAQTYIEIEKHPSMKSDNIFGGGSGTSVLTWNVATDPNSQSDIDVGYKAIKSVCEYRWVIDVTSTTGYINLDRIVYNGSTVTNPSDPYTTPWSGNPTISLEVDYGVQTASIAGTAYFEVRKVWNGTTYSRTSNSAVWEVVVENALE